MFMPQRLQVWLAGLRNPLSDRARSLATLFRKIALTLTPQETDYAYLPILIALMTAITLCLGVVTLYVIEERLISSAGETLAVAAANIAEKLDASLYTEYESIEHAATILGLMWPDMQAIGRYLKEQQRQSTGSLWFSLADPDGHIITTTNARLTSDDSIAKEWYEHRHHADDIYVRESQIQVDGSTIKTIAVSAPIRGPHEQLLGVVTNHIELLPLEKVFEQTARLLQKQHQNWWIEWQFLNRNGDVLADSILRQEGKVNLKLMGLPSALFAGSAEPGYVEEIHVRRLLPVVSGYAQTRGYKRFTGLYWGVLVRLDRHEILRGTRSVLWKLGMVEAVMFLPMLTLLVWTTHQLRTKWMRERRERERAGAAEAALRQEEAALRREKEFSEKLINSSIDGILAFDRQCRYTLWNRGMECMSGIAASQLIGKCAFEVFPFLKEIGEDEYFRQVLDGHSVVAKDRPYYVPKTNKQGYFEAYYSPLFSKEGDVEGALAIIRDTTARKAGETALRESEERFRLIFDHAKDAILLTDARGVVFWANREAERVTDRSLAGLAGKPIMSLFAEPAASPGEEILLGELPEGTRECAILRPDGASVPVETNATWVSFSDEVFGRIVIARDLTERLRMEQKLRQADKLAALGTLLGGVAHELKNPLFIIRGNVQIAKQLTPDGKVIEKNLDAIEESAHRATSIVDRFLRVMRSMEHHRKECLLNDVMTSTLELVSHSIAAHRIDVRLELMPDLPALVSDPEGLSQVFLNLFTNACHALGSIEGDRILSISTNLISTSSGPCVESRVTDNGPGIPSEHLSFIFDPFFTTKPVGQGTGLGLSISHRIVTELGGVLSCESKVGQGTTFIVQLAMDTDAAREIMRTAGLTDFHGTNSSH